MFYTHDIKFMRSQIDMKMDNVVFQIDVLGLWEETGAAGVNLRRDGGTM